MNNIIGKLGERKTEPLNVLIKSENKQINDSAIDVLLRIIKKKYKGRKCLKRYVNVYNCLFIIKLTPRETARKLGLPYSSITHTKRIIRKEAKLWAEEVRGLL